MSNHKFGQPDDSKKNILSGVEFDDKSAVKTKDETTEIQLSNETATRETDMSTESMDELYCETHTDVLQGKNETEEDSSLANSDLNESDATQDTGIPLSEDEGMSVAENVMPDEDIPLPDDSMVPPKRSNAQLKNESGIKKKATGEETTKNKPKMFSTNAGIEGEYYGIYYQEYGSDEYLFEPLGRAIKLKKVIKNISNNTYEYVVEFKTETGVCEQAIKKEDAMNVRNIQSLCKYGADIPQKHVNVVIDTLRYQEELEFIQKQKCSYVHSDLGWQKYYIEGQKRPKYMFKSTETVGDNLSSRSQYVGCIAISQGGTFEAWKKMVEDHVLGHAALETILIASLASVIVGLIGDVTTGECPILHFADSSSSGKTTAAMLAASVGGRPFHGRVRNTDTGKLQNSLLQSWGGTVNALLGMQKGNMGFPIILDELSKIDSRVDLTQLVYNFSEGTDKARMNQDLEVIGTEPFRTSIVSFGEVSLLDKCKSKNDGLRLRVFEISGKLTEDAEHSRVLKKLCRENYGFALEKMASYIIDNEGKTRVLRIYKKAIRDLSDSIPVCQSVDRFFEKFHAVYLTTAYIAKESLGIKFHLKKIFNFLNENLEKKIEKGNSAESAYERLIEKFRANPHHISFKGGDPDKKVECWGAYSDKAEVTADGKKIIGEYSIRVHLFAKLLKDLGFENKDTILKDFKKFGYLNHEDDRYTRRRKIGSGTAELCYVLRVFAVEASEDDRYDEIKPALQVYKNQVGTYYTGSTEGEFKPKPPISKQMKTLLT